MRRNLVRRALAAAGVMALVASGIAISSSSAGATPVYSWHYSPVDCKESRITVSVGGFVGGANGNGSGGGGGSNVYSIRAFCAADYTQGHIETDPTTGQPTYKVTYTPPSPDPAGRGAQFDSYKTDLQSAWTRIFQDLGSATPGTPRWNDINQAAVNYEAAVDQINVTMATYTPDSVLSEIHDLGWVSTSTGQYGYYGSAHLRNTQTVKTNGWTWGSMSQDVNGNLGASGWAKGFGVAIGQGGVLAGCGHTETAYAIGGADSTKVDQTWDATSTFGCGITGGSSSGVAVALTGISVDYRVEFQGQIG